MVPWQELVDTFNFHNYDILAHLDGKIDPRKKSTENESSSGAIIQLMYSVTKGDIDAVRR